MKIENFQYVSASHVMPLMDELACQSELSGVRLNGEAKALIKQFLAKSYEYGCRYGYKFSQEKKS